MIAKTNVPACRPATTRPGPAQCASWEGALRGRQECRVPAAPNTIVAGECDAGLGVQFGGSQPTLSAALATGGMISALLFDSRAVRFLSGSSLPTNYGICPTANCC